MIRFIRVYIEYLRVYARYYRTYISRLTPAHEALDVVEVDALQVLGGTCGEVQQTHLQAYVEIYIYL